MKVSVRKFNFFLIPLFSIPNFGFFIEKGEEIGLNETLATSLILKGKVPNPAKCCSIAATVFGYIKTIIA